MAKCCGNCPYLGECPSTESLLDLFSSDVDEGQTYCGLIEERIVDVVIIGFDLYALEKEALDDLANDLEEENEELEAPGFFGGWGDYEEMVPMIRPFLRSKALSGAGGDYRGLTEFLKSE